ncbi:hypothetical protein K431DRAFT_216614 [Polychaeton citri CBS 116435]|uniref:RRM domain-containing protein n=1 Tax=Polychaeton citri CBS 116435 TaxID=1314669 RepID=A0A9P4QGB6_9PEZI|nr:hypothetical protein K431DRAFT_216614 [Polychaeton citri CBS 116435]
MIAACQDSTCSQSQAYCSTPQHQHDRSWSFSDRSQLHTSDLQRKRTYGVTGKPTSLLNDSDDLDLDGCLVDSSPRLLARGLTAAETPYDNAPRTIYFCGLPDLTSYSELLSVVKGGKLVSLNMPSERSATVSFLDPEAASKYLAWAKRNDVYIRNKRVEVRWAERQFTINSHIVNKIQNGATRNLIISDAQDKGLSERQIRDDMDHIHGLAITGVSFRQGDAHVSMNSIHNALFARTCMLSRTAYKGCKVQFVPDECDVPLPERMRPTKVPAVSVSMEKRRQGAVSNRFDLLNTEGTESGSDVGSDQTSEVDSVGCSS